MHLAIVHDWLNGMRGGEKVLEALLEIFPGAEIYTLFHERGKVSARIESHRITTSWLNRLPGVYRHYRELLPLFPSAVESLDVRGFDVVISSSHAVAKGVRTGDALHVCYCHTPMRYAWDAARDYRGSTLRFAALSLIRPWLQHWDKASAAAVHHFIANSNFVRNRIRECYQRDAVVIPPPIDTRFFTPSSSTSREDYYLAAGALVPYKRFDVVVQAFNKLGRRLVVAGSGPEYRRLRRMAAANIEFAGWVDDEELRRLYRSARGLVFAAREDFGMIPVEAQACGCPAIALNDGGSAETIVDGISGLLFKEQTPEDLIRAVHSFETREWPADQVRSQAGNFSREIFQTRIQNTINDRLAGKVASGQGTAAFAAQTA